jgi:hypothetical protein
VDSIPAQSEQFFGLESQLIPAQSGQLKKPNQVQHSAISFKSSCKFEQNERHGKQTN